MSLAKSRTVASNPVAGLPPRSEADRLLGMWAARALAIGMLGWACVPALRGYNHYIGWLPFWLLAAPTILLALTYRHRLAAALSAFLVGRRRRRILFPQAQARRASAAARAGAAHGRKVHSRSAGTRRVSGVPALA